MYAHPRDSEGRIKVPEENKATATPSSEPDSLEKDLRDLTVLVGMFRVPQEKYEELAQKIKAKWAAKTGGGTNGG